MAAFFHWVIFALILSSFISASFCSHRHPESFGVFLHDYANKTLKKPRTGHLYNISLPSNFSGIEASFIRLRSGSFWARGANFSSVYIPPRVIPMPYVKRIALVYENLGNFSSYFYQVPGHSFVAPVIGFTAYKSSNSSAVGKKLQFSLMGDPILVMFPEFDLQGKNLTPKCVKFGTNGTFEFINMSRPYVCETKDQGQFSIVVPYFAEKREDKPAWRWWVLIVGSAFTGLILLVSMAAIVARLVVKKKKMRRMEEESEMGVALDSVWIGRSKMPRASMIKTRPDSVENDDDHEYAPT